MELSTSIDLIDEKEPFKTLFSGDLPQDGNPICCARENQTIVAVSTTAIIINKHEVEIEFDFPVSKICWDQGGQFALIADEGGNIHLLHSSGRIVLSQKLIQSKHVCIIFCFILSQIHRMSNFNVLVYSITQNIPLC